MFYTSSLIYRRNKLFARQLCDCGLGFMSRERKEIAVIITHTAFYTGWPKGWAVFNLAKEVWNVAEGDLTYEDEAMRAHAKSMVFPIGAPNDAFAKYFIGQSYLAPVSTD